MEAGNLPLLLESPKSLQPFLPWTRIHSRVFQPTCSADPTQAPVDEDEEETDLGLGTFLHKGVEPAAGTEGHNPNRTLESLVGR